METLLFLCLCSTRLATSSSHLPKEKGHQEKELTRNIIENEIIQLELVQRRSLSARITPHKTGIFSNAKIVIVYIQASVAAMALREQRFMIKHPNSVAAAESRLIPKIRQQDTFWENRVARHNIMVCAIVTGMAYPCAWSMFWKRAASWPLHSTIRTRSFLLCSVKSWKYFSSGMCCIPFFIFFLFIYDEQDILPILTL